MYTANRESGSYLTSRSALTVINWPSCKRSSSEAVVDGVPYGVATFSNLIDQLEAEFNRTKTTGGAALLVAPERANLL